MGQRGPKPKPRELKVLAGNPGKRAIPRTGGTRYTPGAPTCPLWLSAAAKRVFARVVKELAGATATVDADLIASYAGAVADLAAVSRAIDKAGVVILLPTFNRNGKPTGHNTQKPNPLLRTKDALLGRVKQLADALGIGPAARSRTGATPEPAAPERVNKVLEIRDRIQAARAGARTA
jgi:P27 family predicted phage terminase small subunit